MNKTSKIKSRLIKEDSDACLPHRQTLYSIGYDLHSNENITIPPKECIKVNSGYKVELYKNDETGEVHYAELRGRSSLSKIGIIVINGLIDPDYNDALHIIINNTTDQPFIILKGDRIAQLVIIPYNIYDTMLHDENNNLIRPKNAMRVSGFGSTGK